MPLPPLPQGLDSFGGEPLLLPNTSGASANDHARTPLLPSGSGAASDAASHADVAEADGGARGHDARGSISDTQSEYGLRMEEDPEEAESREDELEAPKASFMRQVVLLSARHFNDIARNPGLLLLHYAMTVVSAAILSTVFYRLENNFGGIQDRVGFLFFLIFFFSLSSISSLSHFVEERRLFVRERNNRYYSTTAYVLCKIVTDTFPLRVLPPLLFGLITYRLIGLQPSANNFLTFLVILVLVNVVATAACFFISTFSAHAGRAALIAIAYFVFCMLFAGLFVNSSHGSSTTGLLSRIRYLSFFHYGFDALMINEFPTEQVLNFNPTGASVQISGLSLITSLAIDQDDFTYDIFALMAMAVTFYSLGFIVLKYYQSAKR
jgi:ABC-type multidrug transport system permease subunit